MRIPLILLLLLAGCAGVSVPDQRPADFSVRYAWEPHALPREYSFRRTIQIAPDGAGEATVVLGYGEGPSHTIPFQLDDDALDALYTSLHNQDFFSTRWRQGEIPEGASSWELTVTAAGHEVHVPAYAKPYDNAESLHTIVFDAVPAGVLAALDTWREARQ